MYLLSKVEKTGTEYSIFFCLGLHSTCVYVTRQVMKYMLLQVCVCNK